MAYAERSIGGLSMGVLKWEWEWDLTLIWPVAMGERRICHFKKHLDLPYVWVIISLWQDASKRRI